MDSSGPGGSEIWGNWGTLSKLRELGDSCGVDENVMGRTSHSQQSNRSTTAGMRGEVEVLNSEGALSLSGQRKQLRFQQELRSGGPMHTALCLPSLLISQ